MLTVLTRAASGRLVAVDDARLDLGLSIEAFSDARLARMIDQASSRAASYCRRAFGRQVYRERFGRLDLGMELLLDASPVVAVRSVVQDGVTLDPAAYELDGRLLFRLRGNDRCCWSGRSVVVEYEAGWQLPGEDDDPSSGAIPLPADVEKAVIQLVGVAVSVSGRDAMVKSESVEGVGSTDWYVQGANASLPHPEAEAALSQYRRLLFA